MSEILILLNLIKKAFLYSICCLTILWLWPWTAVSQSIKIDCTGLTTFQILDSLERKYDVKIFVHDTLGLSNKLTGNCLPQKGIESFLRQIFINQPFGVLPYNDKLFVVADTSRINYGAFTSIFSRKKQIDEALIERGITIGHSDSISRSGYAIISGSVIDGKTDSPVVGAYVRILSTGLAEVTDASGRFVLRSDIGSYTMAVEAGSYHTFQTKIKLYSDGIANIKLYTNSIELPEVVIGASAQSRLESVYAGVAELSVKEIKKLPSLLGETDVIKAILTLPGVSSTGEVGSGFNVRGGNIDQNLIQQDGVFYLNPSHVIGLFSSFNPDAINSVTFYKGHIPAQFGGRTSSVLDIKLKEPILNKWSLNGGIGPLTSKLYVEGPILKDKLGFFAGARINYSDWLLKLMRDPNLKNSKADFYDLNVKVAYKMNVRTKLQYSYYGSEDVFTYSDQFGYGWRNASSSFLAQHVFNDKMIFQFTAAYSNNSNDFFDGSSPVDNQLENGMVYLKTKSNLSAQIRRIHQVNIGTETVKYLTKPENFFSESNRSQVQQSRGNEYSIYINDEFKISNKFSLSAGLRQSFYANVGPEDLRIYAPYKSRVSDNIIGTLIAKKGKQISSYQTLEPRLSLAYQLSSEQSLKWSYNKLAQYIHLISNTAAATPLDLWQMSNLYLEPQRSNNYSVGYYKNFKDNEWETSIELYFRSSKNIVEYKDFAKLLRNEKLEQALFAVQGKSFGSELYIKRNRNNPTGYVSYTFSRSLRKSGNLLPDETINGGQWYPAGFDKPHNLNTVINFQLRKTMALSFNFIYSSGRPLTAPVADFYLGDDGIFLDYSNRNQYRIPDYHRLDVSYTLTRGAVRTQKKKGSVTLSIYNLYSRRNAFSVYYRRNANQPLIAYKLAVLGTAIPSITYNFQL